jgi:transposase InsO family protein
LDYGGGEGRRYIDHDESVMGNQVVHEQLKVLQDELWRVGCRLEEAGSFRANPQLLGDYKRINKQLGKTLKRAPMSHSGDEMLATVQGLLERARRTLDNVAKGAPPVTQAAAPDVRGHLVPGVRGQEVGCAFPASGEEGVPTKLENGPSSDIYVHPLRIMRKPVEPANAENRRPEIPLGTPVATGLRSKGARDAAFRARIVAMVGSGGVSLRDAASGVRRALRGEGEVAFDQAIALLSSAECRRYVRLSERTIIRWCQRVRTLQATAGGGGAAPSALQCLRHHNTYARTPRKATAALVEAVREMALAERAQHYSAERIALQMETLGFGKVRASLVRRILRTQLTPVERQYYRFGWKGVAQGFDSKLNREAQFPNQVWLMDHSYLPQEAITRWKDEEGSSDCDLGIDVRRDQGDGGRISTVHCTMIKDAYSRRTLALRLWDKHPSARETLLVLRDAMQRYGRPVTLYTDNGGDFVSGDVAGLLAVSGVSHVKTRPYEPEGRGKIERAFGTLKGRFLADLPGFRGKDAICQWGDEDLLTVGELERQLLARIEEDERTRPHAETKRCPAEAFDTDRLADTTIYAPGSQEALLSLLLIARVKRTAKGVTFRGRTYDSEHLGVVQHGCDVTVHFDPANPGTVHFSLPGRNGMDTYLGEGVHYSRENPPPPIGVQKKKMRAVQSSQIRRPMLAEFSISEAPGPVADDMASMGTSQEPMPLPAAVEAVAATPKATRRPRSRTAAKAVATTSTLTPY